MARLLLVDDDPIVARALCRILTRQGHQVEVLGDPVAALARARTAPFDLVITDFRMPELDGLKLANLIAAEDPAVPIILLTGSFDVDLVRVQSAGVVAVLAKPVDAHVLVEAVRTHARPPVDPATTTTQS